MQDHPHSRNLSENLPQRIVRSPVWTLLAHRRILPLVAHLDRACTIAVDMMRFWNTIDGVYASADDPFFVVTIECRLVHGT